MVLRYFLWALLATGSTVGALLVFLVLGEQRHPLLIVAGLGGSAAGLTVTAALIMAAIAVSERAAARR